MLLTVVVDVLFAKLERLTTMGFEILTRELARLVAEEGRKDLRSLRAQAKFLEISPSHLSRLRRGQARLSIGMAMEFAARLRSNPEEQRQLAAILVDENAPGTETASLPSATSAFVTRVNQFFGRLREQSIVCVEYRDYPRTDDSKGKYPDLAKAAAEAVRQGACLALFQPFGSTIDAKSTLPPELKDYLAELQRRVRRVYAQMRDLAGEGGASKRIVLYERLGSAEFLSGIQSRMFYLENRLIQPIEHSVWEWVAGEERDYFIKRDPESILVGAMAEQFEPVVSYWRKNFVLPNTEIELEAAKNTFKEGKYQQWKIFTH